MLLGQLNGFPVSALGTLYFPLLTSLLISSYEVLESRDCALPIFEVYTIKHNTFYTVSPEYVWQLNQWWTFLFSFKDFVFIFCKWKKNVELIISGSVKRFEAPGTDKNYQKSLYPFTFFSPKTHWSQVKSRIHISAHLHTAPPALSRPLAAWDSLLPFAACVHREFGVSVNHLAVGVFHVWRSRRSARAGIKAPGWH